MSIARGGTNVNVTWTGGVAPYVVQQTGALPAGSWSDKVRIRMVGGPPGGGGASISSHVDPPPSHEMGSTRWGTQHRTHVNEAGRTGRWGRAGQEDGSRGAERDSVGCSSLPTGSRYRALYGAWWVTKGAIPGAGRLYGAAGASRRWMVVVGGMVRADGFGWIAFCQFRCAGDGRESKKHPSFLWAGLDVAGIV